MSCKLVSLKAFSMQVVSDCCMSILSKIVTVQYQNENMDVLSLNFVTAQVGRNQPKILFHNLKPHYTGLVELTFAVQKVFRLSVFYPYTFVR